MKNLLNILILLACFWLPIETAMAQSVHCTVKVDAELLAPEDQNEIRYLSETIENYVNTFEYTDETYDIEIEIIFQIYVESVNKSGSEHIYRAQAVVTNNYDQRYFEKKWLFVGHLLTGRKYN